MTDLLTRTPTRYLVSCDRPQLPLYRRNGTDKVLAVQRASGQWIGFWPNPTHNTGSAEQYGWLIGHQITTVEIDALGIRDLMDTHRGWHIRNVRDATVLHMPTVEELQAEIVRLKAEHEAFKVRASDILAAGANDHDLCGAYDEIAEDAGLYPRPHDHDVEIEVTYRQTVTLNARTWTLAAQDLKARTISNHFEPSLPFADDNLVDNGSAYAIKVTFPDLEEN